MLCPNCHNDVPNGYRYCLQCGEDLGAPTVVRRPETVTRVAAQVAPVRVPFDSLPVESKGRGWVLPLVAVGAVAVLALALLAIGGVLYLLQPEGESEPVASKSSSPSPAPTPRARLSEKPAPAREPTLEPTREPTPEPTQEPAQPHKVVEDSLFVPAQRMVWYTFTVPTRARVYGRFRATGGKNDIYAALVDDDGLENFRNGNGGKAFYSSGGYITTDTIDCQLAPGRYHIVFSNTKALLTNKMVAVLLNADY